MTVPVFSALRAAHDQLLEADVEKDIGSCLALEFAARHARRYAAVIAFSGRLIGPPGTPRDYTGDFAGSPVFIGCSDVDPHVPLERVQESAAVLRRPGAVVDERIYPRMGPHHQRRRVTGG